MHKSNLPSIISSSHNEVIQSCLIYNEIVFLGLRNGFVEIFEYKKNTKISEITNFFDSEEKKSEKEMKYNPHSHQIISIQLLKELPQSKDIMIFIQSRGGIIFIEKYNIKNNNCKLLIKYDTKIETFTEFFITNKIFRKDWDTLYKNIPNEKNTYKIMYPLEKNNEIEILFYTIDNDGNTGSIIINNTKDTLEKINQNFDYIVDEEGQKIIDVYKDLESKILQLIHLSKNDNNYMVMVYETTLIFILDENMNYISHYSLSFSLKLYESIINIYSFKYKNDYFICIGLFAKNLIILKFDNEKKELKLFEIIKDICPEVKYGISCFAVGIVKSNDLFMDDDLIENKFLFFVGTYSKRVKIFEIIDEKEEKEKIENNNNIININNNEEKIKFMDLGNLIVDNSGAINQIKFFDGNLFVVCDRKILYIYSI
jgi:hypothetical protein